VGRHTQPGTGTPEPDTGFWVRLAVGAVALLLVGGWWLSSRDDDAPVRTAGPDGSAGTTSSPTSSSGAPAPASSSTSPSPSASPTKRPPTLSFAVKRNSYITVRVPGGQTLVSRLFKAGAKRSFDNKVLQVVNGRPTAVRFTVNGKPRDPGPADQPETFTVRRR
jgi:hypothetical protein